MCTIIGSGVSVHFIKNTHPNIFASPQSKQNITMTVLFAGPNEMGKSLVDSAADKLRSNHPDLVINIKYIELPVYNNTRYQILNAITNGTSVDIVTLDQIWLGEFAQKGLLTDLANHNKKWGQLSDWYQSNLDGSLYNNTIYGIWAWTDVRGIWYWKDLLNKAGVDPNSLETWNGYIAAAKKLDTVLRPQGIEGIHLTGASHSPDLWYPYLWMLGGDILELREGHPTKGAYWFPAYNSSEGIQALGFIRDQINAGIIPACCANIIDRDFAQKRTAMMLGGSWIPGEFPNVTKQDFESKIGFVPMFPVPDNKTHNSTLMGGWQFNIPVTSSHKSLAWELIQLMLQPQILAPWIAQQGYLPTQISLGEGSGPFANLLRKSIPFYDEMVSMIPVGQGRPSIPEYPAIADDIREALD
ncbi:MAG TPA: extracellular solute-binding protein, partial [Nitrososphaeraceae archaeon]|nr:extracellular solute-binding protein [Nitrososphaeraceae archaeon]